MYSGEAIPSDYVAELYAQVMARIYVMQYCKDFMHIPIHIMYDSISAADSSRGHTNACGPLEQFTVLCHTAACRSFDLSSMHVHAHDSQPWNEMVDSLCNYHKTHAPCLWQIPNAPITSDKLFCLGMAVALDDSQAF